MSTITVIHDQRPNIDDLSLRDAVNEIGEAAGALASARANMLKALDRVASFGGDWAETLTLGSMAFTIAFEQEAQALRDSALEEGGTGRVLMGELLQEEIDQLLLMGAIALDGPTKALELVRPSVED